MAHIDLGPAEELPGIRGLLAYRRDTGEALSALAEVLLRGPSPLSRGERELIATHVSTLNNCEFCSGSHAAVAALQLDAGTVVVDAVRKDLDSAPVTPLLRALLEIAGAVRQTGQAVNTDLLDAAREQGATDAHIHDTVLIAAAFSMYNRYVDGLGTHPPADPSDYIEGAHRLVDHGYALPQ